MNWMTELSEKRDTAATKLAALRKQRGSDVLDGRKPDTAKIDALANEVDSLDEAEAEGCGGRGRRSEMNTPPAERSSASSLLCSNPSGRPHFRIAI